MKKVGIVSCYFQPNYGSMLQAYATQMAIEKLGYENETIDISGFVKEIKKAKLLFFIESSLTSNLLFSNVGRIKDVFIRKINKNEYTNNKKIRNSSLHEFEKRHFKMSPVFNSKDDLSKKCSQLYDAIVVGSDQLWLPSNIAADYYTLNFVPESINTIAYSTSFGQSVLPKKTTNLARIFLKKIRHIGVREESGAKLIKEITGRSVPVVCDPTLLFTGNDWMSIQDEEPIIKDGYIFSYFLGNNPLHREFVSRLKKEKGLRVVCLPHIDEYVKEDETCSDLQLYDIDPGQFLNLIRNAKYVCTDSFHCSVFSLEYEKEFFTFRRFKEDYKQSTNSRLDTLFKIAGTNNRLIVGDEEIDKVLSIKTDYDLVRERLEKIREESYSFLRESLADQRSTDL